MTEIIDIKVPILPESITEATIVEWHKQAGEVVKINDILAEIETDKVVLEIPSEINGIMGKILQPVGSVVTQQQILASIKETTDTEPQPELASAADIDETINDNEHKKAGPAAQKAMREANLTREEISATGKNNRILKTDVSQHSSQQNSHSITDRFEERVPMSSLRKTVAAHLLKSKQQTAMLTTFNELDMSAIITIRKNHQDHFISNHGIKLGFMSFFVQAAVAALKKFPTVNAFVDEQDIIYHGYCDIGVAVSSKRGLVVPVLKDAHQMSLHQIEAEIANLSNRAQSGKLTLDEITGGTFTISNGGVFGSMLSTPILNAPQSAILGMHKIEQRPVVIDSEIKIRPIMYLALSYDHRIIDGKEAVLFLNHIKNSLADPSRLLLNI